MYEEKPDLDYLAHYGVKGMKWGVRKVVRSIGRSRRNAAARRKANKKLKKKEERARAASRKAYQNRHTLSDAELDKRIARVRKEKALRDLTKADLDSGNDFIRNVVEKSADKVAPVVVSGAGLYFVNAVVTQQPTKLKAEQYITPRPKNK